jgi:cytosine/uracil/thiamine/allantoin permease
VLLDLVGTIVCASVMTLVFRVGENAGIPFTCLFDRPGNFLHATLVM